MTLSEDLCTVTNALERTSWASWLITIIIASLIFYVSSLTVTPEVGSGVGLRAIVYHFGIFAALAFFLTLSLARGRNKKQIFFALCLVLIYAAFDEFHQSFVPGRDANLFDFFTDATGVLLGSIFYAGQK